MTVSVDVKSDQQKARLSSVATAIQLLKAFSGKDAEIGISDLAKRLGVAKSTVHRLVVTLVSEELLEQNPETGRYRLGLGLFSLGSLVRHRMDLSSMARPLLMDLREEIGETILLAVPTQQEAMYILHLESRHAVRMRSDIGVHIPYYCTAAGRAILAHLPEQAIEKVLAAPMPLRTPNTVSSPDKLLKVLAAIRKNGYSTEDEESEFGIRAISAAIFDASGRVAGAVGIGGPIQRLSMRKLTSFVAPLKGTAQRISQRLGHES